MLEANQRDQDILRDEQSVADLYDMWSQYNASEFDGQLTRPVIRVRAMARSQAFFRAKPYPTIVINSQVVHNNWSKALSHLMFAMIQQKECALGLRADGIRRTRDRSSKPVQLPKRQVGQNTTIDAKGSNSLTVTRDPSKATRIPVDNKRGRTGQLRPTVEASQTAVTLDLLIEIPRAQLDAIRLKAHQAGEANPVLTIRGVIVDH